MPILEITQLRLKGVAAHDPALLENLSDVRRKIQTSSRFYSCIEDPALIYILGIWPSLEAHLEFLASPARDEVLGPQENVLKFCWTAHLELDSMNSLPLDTPVLGIEKLRIGGGYRAEFEQVVARYAHILESTHTTKVKHAWRCDPPGSHELFLFSGWRDLKSHVTFAEKHQGGSGNDVADITCPYDQMQIHHARCLERAQIPSAREVHGLS
ncbi:hypothetical protein T440DRAFT_427557 [Plenodomus tracheiphilus IPT5]|uniref:ABM domain-containing protein n=1 Tax=Plenodomus tracheiphilus IPT5 TaxID=1408161 RepID=A0A6A7B3I8_9PLEO|nr:hypothetical protein T440DRAFT_427557 [Plenodomus tracheiphilus IPT5]